MSFLKKLFGGGDAGSSSTDAAAAKTAEYKGFMIEARPYKEGGQYQLAGVITKEIDGVRKEHKYVRADRFSGIDEAADIALMKGRQIIDERGDGVFG
ncbi:MAG: HlyU family transcriptional regulator [Hyphomicrobiaceae bacterium]